MFGEPHSVYFNGKKVSLKALTIMFNVAYDSCLRRWNMGMRDPWELLFGRGAQPVKFTVTEDDLAWLRETRAYRKGQTATTGRHGTKDGEWEIACDLIGIPRVFANELKEALCSR